jgi:hypothetical protein
MRTTVRVGDDPNATDVHGGAYAQPVPVGGGVSLSIVDEDDDGIIAEYEPGEWVSFETTLD